MAGFRFGVEGPLFHQLCEFVRKGDGIFGFGQDNLNDLLGTGFIKLNHIVLIERLYRCDASEAAGDSHESVNGGIFHLLFPSDGDIYLLGSMDDDFINVPNHLPFHEVGDDVSALLVGQLVEFDFHDYGI